MDQAKLTRMQNAVRIGMFMHSWIEVLALDPAELV